VGAVAGGGYGAYKTKQECGTILGGSASNSPGAGPRSASAEAPFKSDTAPRGDITIYDAR
jgi:hypothetical protein